MQWLQAEQQHTRAALTKARTLDRDVFNPNDGAGDQSRRLEAWSWRRDVEAMSVVWPLREICQGRTGKAAYGHAARC